jgi:hypothetical protein
MESCPQSLFYVAEVTAAADSVMIVSRPIRADTGKRTLSPKLTTDVFDHFAKFRSRHMMLVVHAFQYSVLIFSFYILHFQIACASISNFRMDRSSAQIMWVQMKLVHIQE